MGRIELPTYSLPWSCSTPELHRRVRVSEKACIHIHAFSLRPNEPEKHFSSLREEVYSGELTRSVTILTHILRQLKLEYLFKKIERAWNNVENEWKQIEEHASWNKYIC